MLKLLFFVVATVIVIKFLSKFGRRSESKTTESDIKKYAGFDDWSSDLKTLWSGPPQRVEFSYPSNKGDTKKRKVDINRVAAGKPAGFKGIGKTPFSSSRTGRSSF